MDTRKHMNEINFWGAGVFDTFQYFTSTLTYMLTVIFPYLETKYSKTLSGVLEIRVCTDPYVIYYI